MDTHEENLSFIKQWTLELLKNAQNPDLTLKEAIGRCSQICYDKNHMAEKWENIHCLEDYVNCLQNDFGWTVDFNPATKVLICQENNTECLCPIVRESNGNIAGSICYCTESELVRMTQNALGVKARATVLRSFVRDNKSCVYRIEILS